MGPETVVLLRILAPTCFARATIPAKEHDVDLMVKLFWLLPAEYEAQYYAARSGSTDLALK